MGKRGSPLDRTHVRKRVSEHGSILDTYSDCNSRTIDTLSWPKEAVICLPLRLLPELDFALSCQRSMIGRRPSREGNKPRDLLLCITK